MILPKLVNYLGVSIFFFRRSPAFFVLKKIMKNYTTKTGTDRRSALKQMVIAGAGTALLHTFGNTASAHPVMPSGLSPFLLLPKAPLQPGPGGLDIRVWVRSSQTNQQFSCVETAVAPMQMGPAPHAHHDLDEIMYVLEGTATVIVGGKVETVPAGGWHMRPRQIEHTFWNAGDKPLRFIDMYFNQNFEDFLEELFHSIFSDMAKQQLTPADPGIAKRMADLDKRFGVTTFPEKRQVLVDKYHLKG